MYRYILMCTPPSYTSIAVYVWSLQSIIFPQIFKKTTSILYLCSWFCSTVHFFVDYFLFLVNFFKFQCPPLYAAQSNDSMSFGYVFTLAFFFFVFFNSWISTIYRGKEGLQI